MKKKRIVFVIMLLTAIMIACSDQKKNDEDKIRKGWTLAWEDDFDESLNKTVWSKIPKRKNYKHRYMSKNEGLYIIQDGNLILRGVKNSVENDSMPFLTGGISGKSIKKGETNRLEIKARINTVPGATPYISLIPSDDDSNISINLMEQYGNDEFIYQSVSSDYTTTGGMIDNPPSIVLIGVNPNQYHMYGVEKYPDSLVFFVDGFRTRKYPRIQTDLQGQFPFNDLDLDLIMGVSLNKDTDPTALPVDMYIDWVRYYELEPETTEN